MDIVSVCFLYLAVRKLVGLHANFRRRLGKAMHKGQAQLLLLVVRRDGRETRHRNASTCNEKKHDHKQKAQYFTTAYFKFQNTMPGEVR